MEQNAYCSRKEASFIWIVWNKAVAVNLWRVKTNGLINQACLLCGNGKESIMHQLWECRYAQHAWDYTKTTVLCASWSMGLSHFTLLFQCNGSMLFLLLKYQRCFHCVENVWSLFRCIILWSILIECNKLVFNNVSWDGCMM